MKKSLFMITILALLSFLFSPSVFAAEEGGSTLDNSKLNIERATKYYISLDGEKIEYTESNLDLIEKKKKEDIERYNKLTGQDLDMDDVGNNKPVEVIEPVSDPKTFSTLSGLPDFYPVNNGRMVTDGDLTLVQQVFYEGKTGENLRYRYHSFIEWADPPTSQKTDSLASAWDEKAVAVDNSFYGSWYVWQPIIGGFLEDSGTISPDPDSFQAYGNAVKKEVEYGQNYQVTMGREVAVNEDYTGHRANIITKHHHTYLTIKGVGINIGPAAISFNSTWGDTLMVEYGFHYGDR